MWGCEDVLNMIKECANVHSIKKKEYVQCEKIKTQRFTKIFINVMC